MINFIYNKLKGFAKKGIALFMVLGTLLVVVTFAFIMLNIMLSHPRLTQHQVGRIQAYYAAQAGMNYAIEKLRLGNDSNWTSSGAFTHRMCWTTTGCSSPGDILEADLPRSIEYVEITVWTVNSGVNNTRKITSKTSYTYTAP
jgi:Tfp pilus assembly protein PilX